MELQKMCLYKAGNILFYVIFIIGNVKTMTWLIPKIK